MKVKLSSLPDPPDIESIGISGMYGGLNIRSEPEECTSTQSPDMENMWYREGLLRKRWGQKLLAESSTRHERVVQFYDRLFNGYLVWVDGSVIRYADPETPDKSYIIRNIVLPTDTPKGCFVPFEEFLFYKAPGVHIRIKIDSVSDRNPNGTDLPVGEWVLIPDDSDVGVTPNEELVYTPIITINRNPDGSGGDSYQPENRIDPRKIVWFDVDDSSLDYYLPVRNIDDVDWIQVDDGKVVRQDNGQWYEYKTTSDKTYAEHTLPILNGRTFTIDKASGEIGTVTAKISSDVPLYVDETGWTENRYILSDESNPMKWTYLKNVKYSTFDIVPNLGVDYYLGTTSGYTNVINGTELFATTDPMPSTYTNTFVDLAFAKSGIDTIDTNTPFCVFDNGEVMNVLIFPGHYISTFKRSFDPLEIPDFIDDIRILSTTGSGLSTTVVRCSPVFKDYVRVTYEYKTGQWIVTDYRGKTGPAGHIAENCVYANWNYYFYLLDYDKSITAYATSWLFWNSSLSSTRVDDQTVPGTSVTDSLGRTCYRLKSQIGGKATCELSYYDIAKTMISSSTVYTTPWWISENDDIINFVFPEKSYFKAITGLSENKKFFSACGIKLVSVVKADILNPKLTDYTNSSPVGFGVGNIKWSNYPLRYDGVWPAKSNLEVSNIVTKNITTCPDAYMTKFRIAKYLAAKNYVGTISNTTIDFATDSDGNYQFCMLESADARYVVFLFVMSCKVSSVEKAGSFVLDDYSVSSTEFSAHGYVRIALDTNELNNYDITLTTPSLLSNKMRVQYRKSNKDALKAIADCKVAVDYGGSDAVCIAMGNCEKQPNALFWSGNGTDGVDPCYFPMDQYNLVGTFQDGITALAKYSSYLIILQGHQTSKGEYSIETNTNTNRNFIDIAVATINPQRGCDMPWSVQLAENYLCWMDSRHGCMYLTDTSSADENAVLNISENVNGSKYRHGLVYALQNADSSTVCSMDDGKRIYWWIGDQMWVWDYSISGVSSGIYSLSWTKHTGFDIASATTADTGRIFLLNPSGDVIEMADEYNDDMGEKIPCHYTCPTQTFGGFYKKRNVRKLIVECSSEEGGRFRIALGSERASNPGKEKDVALKESMWLYEKDREFTDKFVITPRLLHINHFYFRVESDGDDGGLSVSNAIITYTSGGVNK